MQDFEKLGVFYLGREYDLGARKLTDNLILYDSRDLVTHAVVVGMTGSGKTGLCIDLIEEAAIDGIPSILIDPKGDLPNLLLTFPELRGEDFRPWVNEGEAAGKGLSPEQFAEQQAGLWKKGLAEWGEGGDRIRRLREAAEFAVYTPGSSAGIPVSVLKSFAAPPPELLEDGELFQGRIATTVSSLLGLAGIQADPLQSREHILLSTILAQGWRQGRDLDLATLIQQVQNPPISRIGVLDLESFYPSRERFALVMALNNLLASPSFSTWLEGAALDIGEILHTEQGKPRVAVFSIAHLSDPERMFFVSLLLNQVLGWMRTQPGTTSLRALVYMDEIFGYFPPVQNPPSKQPLLTLLKQARAFGVGIVLATQNPVDLDYKGLSNAGTWFIGRLQTERDKARVMDGLEGAASAAGGSFDRAKTDSMISALGNRVFLMNNAHEDAPVLFQTRWSLSYLRGPLTRQQIKQLMAPLKETVHPAEAPRPAAAAPAAPTLPVSAVAAGPRPGLPPEIPQFFAPARGDAAAGQSLLYRPMLVGAATVRLFDAKSRTDLSRDVTCVTPITGEAVAVRWENAREAGFAVNDLQKSPEPGAQFAPLPAEASRPGSYPAWGRDFAEWLGASLKVDLLRSPATGKISKPGESEREFRLRLQMSFREARDGSVETLRQKYAPKIAALQEKIGRAQEAIAREASQARSAELQTAISVGATILGALFGGGRRMGTIGRATTAARGVGHSMKQEQDVARARQNLQMYQQQLQELQGRIEREASELQSRIDPQSEIFETVTVRPKRTDVAVRLTALLWEPCRPDARGRTAQAG
jgi:DNA helicase HerA-like ATPase